MLCINAVILAMTMSYPYWVETFNDVGARVGIVAVVFTVPLVYEAALVAKTGSTPGKVLLGIQVVGAFDGTPPALTAAAARAAVLTAIMPMVAIDVFLVNWLSSGAEGAANTAGFWGRFATISAAVAVFPVLFTASRQSWHDRAGATIVIRRPIDEAEDRRGQLAKWYRSLAADADERPPPEEVDDGSRLWIPRQGWGTDKEDR